MDLISKTTGGVTYMTARNIDTPHAFTTRFGGVSGGIYSSLNLGENTGDSSENIAENYAALCRALDIPQESLVFSRQVHRADIREVGYGDKHELFSPIPYEADGLITDKPMLPLVIFTADCIPVLLHDPVRKAVGAVHCGWRGTVLDIAGNTVRKMQERYGSHPQDIRAAIGPGIGLCCFETGDDVANAVYNILGKDADRFVLPKEEKYMVDLKGINSFLLQKAGLLSENIAVSGECTMCSHEKYWSHRYTKGQRGSQASVIMLKG